KSTHRDLQVSGELQESICRNKTTAYLLNAIPLPPRGETISGLTFTYESQNALEAPCRNPARKVKLLPDSL
ncbi:hypothetical protein, partial [Sinorhizobium meliloti]|uniref:hypothetical protein n=1 Tax=Rhizobium meliloti TaxID=382 RepID=UPI001AECE769